MAEDAQKKLMAETQDPAADGARPSTEPTKWVDTPYADLGICHNASDSQIMAAYTSRLLRINVDPDNPHSFGHTKIIIVRQGKIGATS